MPSKNLTLKDRLHEAAHLNHIDAHYAHAVIKAIAAATPNERRKLKITDTTIPEIDQQVAISTRKQFHQKHDSNRCLVTFRDNSELMVYRPNDALLYFLTFVPLEPKEILAVPIQSIPSTILTHLCGFIPQADPLASFDPFDPDQEYPT